jgi:hypothetical protein
MQCEHLGWNLHPVGKLDGSGGVPGITSSFSLSSSKLGIELNNPIVYGCRGLL